MVSDKRVHLKLGGTSDMDDFNGNAKAWLTMEDFNGNGQMPDRNGLRTPNWLREVRQQIQALDLELHAALRILAEGEMDPEHMTAFLGAAVQRDRMMARVVSYIAELRNHRVRDRQQPVRRRLTQHAATTHADQRLSRNGDSKLMALAFGVPSTPNQGHS